MTTALTLTQLTAKPNVKAQMMNLLGQRLPQFLCLARIPLKLLKNRHRLVLGGVRDSRRAHETYSHGD